MCSWTVGRKNSAQNFLFNAYHLKCSYSFQSMQSLSENANYIGNTSTKDTCSPLHQVPVKRFRFLCICFLHILLQYVNLTVSYRNVALFAIFAVLKRIRHDFALLSGLCFHLLPYEKSM